MTKRRQSTDDAEQLHHRVPTRLLRGEGAMARVERQSSASWIAPRTRIERPTERRLRIALSRKTYLRCGPTAVSRFVDLTAGLRSFELDCQAADIRENPGSARP